MKAQPKPKTKEKAKAQAKSKAGKKCLEVHDEGLHQPVHEPEPSNPMSKKQAKASKLRAVEEGACDKIYKDCLYVYACVAVLVLQLSISNPERSAWRISQTTSCCFKASVRWMTLWKCQSTW